MKRQFNLKGTRIVGLLLALLVGLSFVSPVARGMDANAIPSSPALPGANESAALDADSDWWAAAQEQIRAAEYHVTWQEQTYLGGVAALSAGVTTGAYQAPNRAHNLRAYFVPRGLIVIPRVWSEDIESPPWCWELSLTAWGRKGALQPVQPAELRAEENRVEYRRGGPSAGSAQDLFEWYQNDENGLKQGFTLAAPPAEAPGEEPLRFDLLVGGDLVAKVAQGGTGAAFLGEDGQTPLYYGELRAVDATGRALAGWLSLQGSTLSLSVGDAGAAYPIQVDLSITGLPTNPDWWTTLSPEEGGWAGLSVATAGDVNGDGYSDVIVGVPHYDGGQNNEGTARIFYGSASGLNTDPDPAFHPEPNQVNALYGWSVAAAGDVNGDGLADVIVGAPDYDSGQEDEGMAFLYFCSTYSCGDTWVLLQRNQANAEFGRSVATAGDVNKDGFADVIVGAPYYTNGQDEEGGVWVWHGSASGLNLSPAWHAEGDQAAAYFGTSVGTAGDVNSDGYSDVIVGANRYEGSEYDEGAAFVWHGSENGLNDGVDGDPTNYAWMAQGDQLGARMGTSVSTAGDVNGDGYADVIVVAHRYSNGEDNEGAAFAWLGSENGLNDGVDGDPTNRAWMMDSNQAGAGLGKCALAGDVNGDGYADVIVGSSNFTNNETEQGRVWVWHGSASGIGPTYWQDQGDQAGGHFGTAVATAGDVNGDGYSDVVVGAPGQDSNAGRAYAYYGGPSSLSAMAGWEKVSGQRHAHFGWSVGTAGDVNGDGYADVVVGMPKWDGGQAMEGVAFVYHGAATGLQSAPAWYKESNKAEAEFGFSVGTAGDVNGDGYDDLIVGAPYWNNGEEDEGVAFVYRGSSTGLESPPAWYKDINLPGARFGFSVGTAGDVNGDGFSDIIVGAPRDDSESGLAFVYHGSAAGLDTDLDWFQTGRFSGDNLGYSVGTAGDVNRDGYSDVIVGAPYWSDGQADEGAAFVYLGSSEGLNPASVWEKQSNQADAKYGFSVGTAGDVNGDGFSDVIVGAPSWHDGQSGEGAAWVYHGLTGGVSSAPNWYRPSNQMGAASGIAVGTAGDINGDGYADVVIGASSWEYGGEDVGAASVYHGSAGGLSTSFNWRAVGQVGLGLYGRSVSTAGDVNGDGYADVIIGAPYYGIINLFEGKAYLYYGNGGPGVSLWLSQSWASSISRRIAHLGKSDSPNSFMVCQRPKVPFGRGGVKQEVEVKRLGVPFDGSDTLTWPAYGSVGPDADYGLGPEDLEAGTPYRWRARWLYSPVTTPWMPASRWVTIPWNGWNEADLRTSGSGGGDFQIFLPLVLRNDD